MHLRVALLTFLSGVAVLCLAQENAVIEVASVKTSNPATCGEYPMIDGHGDRYDLKCVKVRYLIQSAYGVRDFQVRGGPKWIGSTQYDIAVKMASPAGAEKSIGELTDSERRTKGNQLKAMLQTLLAARFQLKVHRETKQSPVLLLNVMKGGSRIKEQSGDISGGLNVGTGFLAGERTGISFLVQALSQITGRPVVDQTGMTGKYNFELKWTPDQSAPNNVMGELVQSAGAPDPDRPPLFAALQEQLGLRLSSGRGPVEMVVVDRVEQPAAN